MLRTEVSHRLKRVNATPDDLAKNLADYAARAVAYDATQSQIFNHIEQERLG